MEEYYWNGSYRNGVRSDVNRLRIRFLIIKPTRCTSFSNLFLKWNSTCFGQFLLPSLEVFHCTHSNGICHTGLLTASSQAVSRHVWNISLPCVQWKTSNDGRRNCPKHVEFHSKNKFEKLVHLVGFIIRNLARCTATWMWIQDSMWWRAFLNMALQPGWQKRMRNFFDDMSDCWQTSNCTYLYFVITTHLSSNESTN
jgi:hypothetical protein